MNLRVIVGADDYLVGEAARKQLVEGAGLEIVDSLNSTNAELQLKDIQCVCESLATPPFLEPAKLTWWKNVFFLPGSKSGSAEVKDRLEKFARWLVTAEIPENQSFVLSTPSLNQRTDFAKTLAEIAEVTVFAAGKRWQEERNAVVRMIDYAREMGLSFASGAAEGLVARVGVDTRTLLSELTKLRDYLGPSRSVIESSDIAEVSSHATDVEPEVWELTDPIADRDLPKAMEALRQYEGSASFATRISASIERKFRDMIAVAEGREGELSPYTVSKISRALPKWSITELKVARARFLRFRDRIVSGRLVSGETLLACELVRTLRRRKVRS